MELNAQAGADLLELQRLDLQIAREKQTLGALPELVELAKKRRAHAKLKAEATKLYAQRKDAETELDELDERELACQEEVEAAQAELVGSSDYRHVQDVERQLEDLAKRLDKIGFDRERARERLEALREREEQLAVYTQRYEAVMRRDAQTARERAAGIQADLEANEAARAALHASLPPETQAAYDAALTRHKGLGVEQLEGSVPSICRTTLPASQLSALRRGGAVGTCPYCGRLIVVGEGAA